MRPYLALRDLGKSLSAVIGRIRSDDQAMKRSRYVMSGRYRLRSDRSVRVHDIRPALPVLVLLFFCS